MKMAVVVVMIVMEAVITVRRCCDRDVSRCNPIAAAQEETEKDHHHPEALERVSIETPVKSQPFGH